MPALPASLLPARSRTVARHADARLRRDWAYFGDDARARRFRYGLIAFDVATIAVFLLSSVAHEAWWMIPPDLSAAGQPSA
jgi:voltage-gated potassium channel